jgi:hypothetical protein
MSAAATAAGYLYASGRLRGKRDEETSGHGQPAAPERKRMRVAVLPEREPSAEMPAAPRPKRVPRVEYRVRRWRPNE